MIEEVRNWLATFSQFRGITCEDLDEKPGSTGLYCRGQEVLWEKEDILGGRHRRLRLRFVLAQHTTDPTTLETFILFNEPQIRNTSPVFGEEQTVKIEQGSTALTDGEGVLRVTALLTFEFTKEEIIDG